MLEMRQDSDVSGRLRNEQFGSVPFLAANTILTTSTYSLVLHHTIFLVVLADRSEV